MKEYTCSRCNYKTPHKSSYNRHLQRKTPCDSPPKAAQNQPKDNDTGRLPSLSQSEHAGGAPQVTNRDIAINVVPLIPNSSQVLYTTLLPALVKVVSDHKNTGNTDDYVDTLVEKIKKVFEDSGWYVF